MNTGQIELPWFALNVRTRYSEFVDRSLKGKGYESFNPIASSKKEPLFPGYLFCRLNIERRLPVLIISGVFDVVRVAGKPAVIPEEEVENVRRISESRVSMQPWPWTKRGQRVRIKSGLWQGIEGVVERVKGQSRLICSVDAIQRSIIVDLDAADVQLLNQPETRLGKLGEQQ
jgi:transcription antitermination factor NusG